MYTSVVEKSNDMKLSYICDRMGPSNSPCNVIFTQPQGCPAGNAPMIVTYDNLAKSAVGVCLGDGLIAIRNNSETSTVNRVSATNAVSITLLDSHGKAVTGTFDTTGANDAMADVVIAFNADTNNQQNKEPAKQKTIDKIAKGLIGFGQGYRGSYQQNSRAEQLNQQNEMYQMREDIRRLKEEARRAKLGLENY